MTVFLFSQRGVAAAIGMLTMTFCMMVGIVMTFSFVLNSMSAALLFEMFIFGGNNLPLSVVAPCLTAIATDYYVLIAACVCTSCISLTLPGDMKGEERRYKSLTSLACYYTYLTSLVTRLTILRTHGLFTSIATLL